MTARLHLNFPPTSPIFDKKGRTKGCTPNPYSPLYTNPLMPRVNPSHHPPRRSYGQDQISTNPLSLSFSLLMQPQPPNSKNSTTSSLFKPPPTHHKDSGKEEYLPKIFSLSFPFLSLLCDQPWRMAMLAMALLLLPCASLRTPSTGVPPPRRLRGATLMRSREWWMSSGARWLGWLELT